MSGQPDGVILTITLFKNYFCLRYANTKKAVNTEHAHEKKGIRAKYYDIEKKKKKKKKKIDSLYESTGSSFKYLGQLRTRNSSSTTT